MVSKRGRGKARNGFRSKTGKSFKVAQLEPSALLPSSSVGLPSLEREDNQLTRNAGLVQQIGLSPRDSIFPPLACRVHTLLSSKICKHDCRGFQHKRAHARTECTASTTGWITNFFNTWYLQYAISPAQTTVCLRAAARFADSTRFCRYVRTFSPLLFPRNPRATARGTSSRSG